MVEPAAPAASASPDEALETALRVAAECEQLDPIYLDCVRPLLREGAIFPRCCGGGCEPCAEQLTRIAERVLTELGRPNPPRRF